MARCMDGETKHGTLEHPAGLPAKTPISALLNFRRPAPVGTSQWHCVETNPFGFRNLLRYPGGPGQVKKHKEKPWKITTLESVF